MDFQELKNIQRNFDTAHGWVLTDARAQALLEMIGKDLIGLFGEVGEFANVIKKLNLLAERKSEAETQQHLDASRNHLEEELIDALIYIVRIATHLNIDIEAAYLKKLATNATKHKDFEIDPTTKQP